MVHDEDELRRKHGTGLFPVAMLIAFFAGAAAGGWFLFGEELKQWIRQEPLVWSLDPDEPVTVLQQERLIWAVSDRSRDLSETTLVWQITPRDEATVPGEVAGWNQELLRVERTRSLGGETVEDLAEPPPEADEEEEPGRRGWRRIPTVEVEHWTDLGAALIGLPFEVQVGDDATTAEAVPSEDTLTGLRIAQLDLTDEELERAEPMTDGETEALEEALGDLAAHLLTDIAPTLDAGNHRLGQVWSRRYRVHLGPWGPQEITADVTLDAYEGDHAILTGVLSRRSGADSLSKRNNGLTGLKGDGRWQVDVTHDRPHGGRIRIEASGKEDGRFVDVTLGRSFVVGPAGDEPVLPTRFELGPPPAPETDEETDERAGGRIPADAG